VGDRIQVNTFTGDVVEIGYFDTTLWEFAGNYMTNDLPSGRLIRFPNSLIFQDAGNYITQVAIYKGESIVLHDPLWARNNVRRNLLLCLL
jgi:hypothetical protein